MKIKIPLAVLAILGLKTTFALKDTSLFSSNMADCKAFISYFDTTTINDPTYGNYEPISCNYPGICPDGTVKNTCTWYKYLAMYCTTPANDNYVDIVVYTNGMPDHCYYSETNPPKYALSGGTIDTTVWT